MERREPIREHLRSLEILRRSTYLDTISLRYRRWTAGEISLSQLASDIGDVIDAHAVEAVETAERAIAAGSEPGPYRWVIEDYAEALNRIGAAIREMIADSTARHAVLQTLQTRVLEAEFRVRGRISALSAPDSDA